MIAEAIVNICGAHGIHNFGSLKQASVSDKWNSALSNEFSLDVVDLCMT